ncbi:MAG TPA: YciI family protein [Micromonosporaceae bacterium]|nr:YciI family protein [Micromonosporaceae bacterium]
MTAMKRYLLSIYQPDRPIPEPEVLDKIVTELNALNDEMRAAGAWVFSGGLHPPSSATVLRARDNGKVLVTDGPYVEGKEHLGGFTIIDTPDLDAALAWGKRLAEITTLPVEVRPFQSEDRPSED